MTDDRELMAELGKLHEAVGRLQGTAEGISRRLDTLNGSVARHEGRIGALEKARERGLGALAAWRWVPHLLTALLGGAVGSLILVVAGGVHG